MISGVFLLLSSGRLGKGDFQDSEEPLLVDCDQTLLTGLPSVNNFLLGNVDDHVKALDLATDDLSDPEGTVHKLFGGLDGDESFALSEEEGKCTADILA